MRSLGGMNSLIEGSVATLAQAISCSNVQRLWFFLRHELFWFCLVLSECLQPSFGVFHLFSWLTRATIDEAIHTSVHGSPVPALASVFGFPVGSAPDLERMGTRSGSTLEEKLHAILLKFAHFRGTTCTASCSLKVDVPSGCTRHKFMWWTLGLTRRDGKEFQRPHCTIVQDRNRCYLSVKCLGISSRFLAPNWTN